MFSLQKSEPKTKRTNEQSDPIFQTETQSEWQLSEKTKFSKQTDCFVTETGIMAPLNKYLSNTSGPVRY